MLFRACLLFMIIVFILSSCKTTVKKVQVIPKCEELTIRTYRLHSEENTYPIFYSIRENGEIGIYKCRFMTSDGNCYYPDSTMLTWLCTDNRVEEFNASIYNLKDSLSFPYAGYRAFFREPYRLQKFMQSGIKDTIWTQYGGLVHKDSIITDKKGFRTYQQVVLDSAYLSGERIFVFKMFMLKEDREKHLTHLYPPTVYHLSGRFLLYFEGRQTDPDVYAPVQEFVSERKVVCPCADTANKTR